MVIVGTHPASKKEIPMAVEALQLELLSVEGSDTRLDDSHSTLGGSR